MIARLGIFAACILILVPAIAIGMALYGDAVTPNDVAASELSEEELGLWGKLLGFALMLRFIGVFPFAFGIGILGLMNWNNGYATWPTWTCVILGSVALIFLSLPGVIVGIITLILANTSRLFAPWK